MTVIVVGFGSSSCRERERERERDCTVFSSWILGLSCLIWWLDGRRGWGSFSWVLIFLFSGRFQLFLLFCLGLIFMFFDSVVVIWGFFFPVGFFCVCLPRKFMGLKAKVCFTGYMGLGFG